MAIKIDIQYPDSQSQPITYPWIGKAENGAVVLFTAPKVGIILKLNDGETPIYKLGEFITSFNMDYFTPFLGEITLSNS